MAFPYPSPASLLGGCRYSPLSSAAREVGGGNCSTVAEGAVVAVAAVAAAVADDDAVAEVDEDDVVDDGSAGLVDCSYGSPDRRWWQHSW